MDGGPSVHRTRATLGVLAIVLALALALAAGATASALGDGGGAGRSPTAGNALRVSPGPPTGGALPDPAKLRAALLTSHDIGLPPAPPSTGSANGGEITGCKPLADILNTPPPAPPPTGQNEQSVAFAGGSTGLAVGETLTTEGSARLAADYAKVAKALTACRSLTFSGDGTRLTFDVTPIKFGGADSAGARMDATYRGVQVNGYLAIQRIGPVIMGYYFFQVGGGSSQLASAYYRQAANKVAHTLGVH